MAVFGNARRHRWTLGLVVLTGGVALGLGISLVQSMTPSSLGTITERLREYREMASAVRLVTILVACLAWPKLVQAFVSPSNRAFGQISSARWRVTAWLLLFELVLGQGLLERFPS